MADKKDDRVHLSKRLHVIQDSSDLPLMLLRPADEVAKTEDDRVHVFTVASGHMYERLQKIMVLSVIRHTQCALAR